ncbi:MAG TPA: hypothetical protein VEQ63_02910 [Bryobacteraceae bacterium]|nr:hypothetical protein [Bryobacteraceae bacterium]
MRSLLTTFAAVCLFSAAVQAQPVIGQGGVLNAASYALSDLPGGGIAQGSMFVVFGQRLGPAAIQQVSAFPLPTALGGTSVKVTVNGTTVDAPMVYTLATQISAIMPSNTPVGTGTLTVTYNGQTSAPAPVRVVRSSFGAFSLNQAGSGPAVVQNFNSVADQPINALNRPARPGQTLILWGTGLGPVSFDDRQAPTVGDVPGNVEVYVGGKLATVAYKGRTSCCAGTDQINFVVPEGVEGCHVPIVVNTGDIVINFTSIAVSRTNTCSDPNGLSSTDIERAQTAGNLRQGSVVLVRSNSKFSIPGAGSFDQKSDTGSASFFSFNLNQLLTSQGSIGEFASMSVGSCSLFTFKGDDRGDIDPVEPQVLDAGPAINVSGPRGNKQLTKGAGGFYSATLGGGSLPIPGAPAGQPDFLEPGSYRIDNGSGGTQVGAFTANLTLGQLLNWDNMNAVENVSRSQGQTIEWSGGDPAGYTSITGMSTSANASAMFYCMERTSARRFTIPSYVLLNLPATTGENFGFLSVSGMSAGVPFTASGLDSGQVYAVSGNMKTVNYR